MRMETKIKKRSSGQTDKIFGQILVLHHKMVSPQNGDTWGEPPPTQRHCSKRYGFIYSSQLLRFSKLEMAKMFAAFVTSFQ